MLNQVIYENKEITSWCLSELITQTRNIFALAGYKGPLIETVEFSNTINKEVKLAKNGSSQFIFFVAVLCFSIIHLAMRTNIICIPRFHQMLWWRNCKAMVVRDLQLNPSGFILKFYLFLKNQITSNFNPRG